MQRKDRLLPPTPPSLPGLRYQCFFNDSNAFKYGGGGNDCRPKAENRKLIKEIARRRPFAGWPESMGKGIIGFRLKTEIKKHCAILQSPSPARHRAPPPPFRDPISPLWRETVVTTENSRCEAGRAFYVCIDAAGVSMRP